VREAELGEQIAEAPEAGGAIDVERLEDGEDVVLDAQPAEDRGLLRQVGDSLPRPDVHRIVGDVGAIELDAAGVRRGQADDHVERRRLAGAVRAEQTDHLAGVQLEADAAHHRAATVRLGERVRAQDGHRGIVLGA
jgi:hypothetical protein